VASSQRSTALAAAIAKTSMTGAPARYLNKLEVFAKEKWTSTEIANDLGVKDSTVASIRKRVKVHETILRELKKSYK
jgi:hypothetical protein